MAAFDTLFPLQEQGEKLPDSLPGIGRYAVDSLLVNDFTPVQGFVLIVLVVYLLVNLVIDLLYGLLNPQVRHV